MLKSAPKVFGLLLWLVALPSYGASAAAVDSLGYVFKAGKYTKVARLATLHAEDLKYASRAQNIDGLFALAQLENRVGAVDALQLSARFNRIDDGDLLLLTCLRNSACKPDTFLSITQTSKLYAEVVRRKPGLNASQVAHEAGAITERMMNRYFLSSGWTRVEGQVGRAGLDGLYVKREGGVIKDVLVAESKYNTSPLGTTKHGTQMSDDWIRRKLAELKARFPDAAVYVEVERYIDNGSYRAVLWNLKVDDKALFVKISKVKGKGGDVEIVDAAGTDVANLWAHPTNTISLASPRQGFEAQIVGWYRAELNALGPATF